MKARDGLHGGNHLANGAGTHHDRLPGEDDTSIRRPIGHNAVDGSIGGSQSGPGLVGLEQRQRGRSDINPWLTSCWKQQQTSRKGREETELKISGQSVLLGR